VKKNLKKILTVTEVTNYIKSILSNDILLSDVWIKGEISNFKHHYTGHMYFTLKDESSLIKCVMFKTQNSMLKFIPEDGVNVIVHGYISVYEKSGQYQLYVSEMEPEGMGGLYLAFEQLKKKLEEKGLFDRARKKPIPFLPRTICVVTSSTGAVIRDIINVISRRFPNVKIRLYPTAVQGEFASGQIARAIKAINEKNLGDVIILARGGGSLEELWPFNEEEVAYAIYESRIPVISAVGHETDFTIADFVADLRAPTPSAAAELVVPERKVLEARIKQLNARLQASLKKNFSLNKAKFEKLKFSVIFKQPYNKVYQERMHLDILVKDLVREMQKMAKDAQASLSVLAGRLESLSPLRIIARGYAAVTGTEPGKIIRSVDDVSIGDHIYVRLTDGNLECTVDNKIREENYGERAYI